MKSIATFSVRHPVAVVMIALGILLLGYISFTRLGIDLFPALDSPRLFVELETAEMPPGEVEERFVEGLEAAASQQADVVRVTSVTRVGASRVTVEYSWSADMDEAFLNLQKAVTQVSRMEDVEELVITQHDPNAEPVVTLALLHPEIDDMDVLRRAAESHVRSELVRIEGIAEVEISGDEEREVVVETDPYLLEAYGLTTSAIASRIEAMNADATGGSIVELGREYVIRGMGTFESIEDIENAVVTYVSPEAAAGGGAPAGNAAAGSTGRVPVYLEDVARVSLRNRDPESIVRVDGRRCVGLDVYKETRFNTVQAARAVIGELDGLRAGLPGYELVVVRDQGAYITGAIDEVKQALLFGILLAVAVLYVFLRRIGTTAIVCVAIPISIVATFNLMYFTGLTLNIMTLGGLALGAGMLVDNAIVVVENILRRREEGKGAGEAAIEGTSQVAGAITASTITTIVVFLPIVYLHGAAGALFREQAWTVAFALVSSLVVAVLIIPMLAGRFLRGGPAAAPRSIRFGGYGRLLGALLDRRRLVIGLAALLVAGAAALLPFVGSEFIPGSGTGEYTLELTLPEGTTLARTAAAVETVEEMIRERFGDEVTSIYSRVGPGTGMIRTETSVFEDENTAVIRIVTAAGGEAASGMTAAIDAMIGDIPEVDGRFVQDRSALQTTLGTESSPVVVEVRGPDLDVLADLARSIKEILAAIPGLANVATSFEEGRPEVRVAVDRRRAGHFDVDVGSIASQLRNRLDGTDAGEWESGGEETPIVLRQPDVGIDGLGDIVLEGAGGGEVRLVEVADIGLGQAPREIRRRDQERVGRVTADRSDDRAFDRLVAGVRERIAADVDLPPGYRLEITGEELLRQESFRSLRFALVLSVVLVYMVLAAQFESLRHPFTILLTIPLAGVGAVFAFLLLGRTLDVMAYIGIIMLAGIAVNDSIILVDAIGGLRRGGMSIRDAIVEAGVRRIRPIVMTSVTTILALLPLTLGFGEGASLRAPMAVAVIGGLVTSTLLTLAVIPCVYHVIDGLGRGE
ncbi:MAG: efflux RND transporter permease subunit [Candidatus Krumholzibacteriota bacterium]|nr:efflux RND transporter permease subunit [Candidatus Krumholzibacteriota bacterium]